MYNCLHANWCIFVGRT